MDSKLELSLLYDFYRGLIPAPQQRAVELYVNDDLSLSEVAEILGISRQGVRDALNRAQAKMRDYESKLHLFADYRARRASILLILDQIEKIRTLTDDPAITEICAAITSNITETVKTLEREDFNGI